MIDSFTRWPEAIPIREAKAEVVTKTVFKHWIARYNAPRLITTNRGNQFEAALFAAMVRLIGSKRCRTIANHPESNGIIERWHRTLETALRCHKSTEWTEVLLVVLLGLRTSYKEDLNGSPAELVYGITLKVPAEFLDYKQRDSEPQIFVEISAASCASFGHHLQRIILNIGLSKSRI